MKPDRAVSSNPNNPVKAHAGQRNKLLSQAKACHAKTTMKKKKTAQYPAGGVYPDSVGSVKVAQPSQHRGGGNSSSSKKPRVSPVKAKEVSVKLLQELVKNYQIGLVEIPMDTLAATVGYKNARSDAILAGVGLLKQEKLASVQRGVAQLTPQGIQDHVPPDEAPVANPSQAMDKFRRHLQVKLASSSSAPQAVLKAAMAIFDLLQDGQAHSMDQVIGVTTYAMERSTGFATAMNAMKDLQFIRVEKRMVKFTDKMFPFGRS